MIFSLVGKGPYPPWPFQVQGVEAAPAPPSGSSPALPAEDLRRCNG